MTDLRLGVMGGTFDPIHAGHVAAALGAQRALTLDRVCLIPSNIPPHRPERPRASGYHRFAMTVLAATPHPTWTVSDDELEREGPSFSYDTLAGLAQTGLHATQIFSIIGADAFAEIATWSRYPIVLDLSHFAVVSRPGATLESLRTRLPDLAARMTTPAAFPDAPGTRIILVETSTPDVSATAIRGRAQSGLPLAGLVPDAVAGYIVRQQLYRTAPASPHSPVGR